MHQTFRPTTPSRSRSRSLLATLSLAALAVAPVAVGAPAHAATTAVTEGAPDAADTAATELTAEVRSIDHGRGIVTLAGSAPAGDVVDIDGQDVEATSAEADDAGVWTAAVRVRIGDRLLHVTSRATGRTIDVPVTVLVLMPPEMVVTVDRFARTLDIVGTGHPGAHLVIKDNGTTVGETDVGGDRQWAFAMRDLSYDDHHIEAWQYFDGTHNGGVDEVFRIEGTAAVTGSSASRASERITLVGRAAAGTTLRFADDEGRPFVDRDGSPITRTTPDDTHWTVDLPIPEDARFARVVVTTADGDTVLGETTASVIVPIALSAAVQQVDGGSVRLFGGGEIGATVSLEDERGRPLRDADAEPISTTVGRAWEIVVPRAVLPADTVVVRQRIDGVDQGRVRLRLPELPVRPDPGTDPGSDPGTVPGTDTGTVPGDGHGAGRRSRAW